MRGAKPKLDLRAHKFATVACAEVREDLVPWRTATDEQIAEELAAEEVAAGELAAAELAAGALGEGGPPPGAKANPEAG
jgi:hypothetical protein